MSQDANKFRFYIKAIYEFSYRLIGKRPESKSGRKKLINTYMGYTGYTEHGTNKRLVNALMEIGFTKEKAKRITRIH